MAQNETWLNHDMLEAVRVQYLDGNLFSMDNAGNLIGVNLTRDGVDYSGGGSVSANVIRADGSTVSVVGALSGNVATVVLPQAAYAVPGVASIVVKLTVSGEVTTIAAVVANVYLSSTDSVVDPGTIIPSVQALISAIESSVASIPADYSALWASLAPAFSTSTNYTAGQYVTYNGALYRFTTNHSAGSWNSAHVTATNIGADVNDLKSAITPLSFADVTWRNGSILSVGNSNAITMKYVLPLYGAKSIMVFLPGLETGQYYRLMYSFFTVDNGEIRYVDVNNRIESGYSYYTKNLTLEIPCEIEAIGFGLALFKFASDGTAIPLRVDSFDTSTVKIVRIYRATAAECDYDFTSNLRNGTFTDAADTKDLTMCRIQPISKNKNVLAIFPNTTLQTGYKNRFIVQFYSIENGDPLTSTSSRIARLNYIVGTKQLEIPIPDEAKGYCIEFGLLDDSGSNASLQTDIFARVPNLYYIYQIDKKYNFDCNGYLLWDNGSLTNKSNANAIYFATVYPVNNAKSVTFRIKKSAPEGYTYRLRIRTFNVESGNPYDVASHAMRMGTFISNEPISFMFENGEVGFAVDLWLALNSDPSTYYPLRLNTFETSDVSVDFAYLGDAPAFTSYVVGVDFQKMPLKTEYIGGLTNRQAFLIYDGKYYSVNNGNYAIQDETFTNVYTSELSFGHGNAFQLGSGNIGYISGWNDNKVYKVNLDTNEIVGEITLPTTGNTTAAIDDLNEIAYIFQKETPSSTVGNYHFIVYDYKNDEIKLDRVISAFSAMQACDYYFGRIIILYGKGSSANPSGMVMYNTSGDILAEYHIDVLQNTEPEGIFIDRATKDIYVSTGAEGNSVYKISQKFLL